jgi:hypothetical protein
MYWSPRFPIFSQVLQKGLLALPLAFASITSGCAALSKGESLEVRYFTLPTRPVVATPGELRVTPRAGPEKGSRPTHGLRIGAIVGSVHLEERLVYRPSASELGFYASLRWTEPPERWLAREFGRQLFQDQGVPQLVGVLGPILEVELTVFEEVVGPPHVARVQLLARLQDGKAIFWQETLSVEVPIAAPGPAAPGTEGDDEEAQLERATLATVDAMGLAMMTVTRQLVQQIETELERAR